MPNTFVKWIINLCSLCGLITPQLWLYCTPKMPCWEKLSCCQPTYRTQYHVKTWTSSEVDYLFFYWQVAWTCTLLVGKGAMHTEISGVERNHFFCFTLLLNYMVKLRKASNTRKEMRKWWEGWPIVVVLRHFSVLHLLVLLEFRMHQGWANQL